MMLFRISKVLKWNQLQPNTKEMIISLLETTLISSVEDFLLLLESTVAIELKGSDIRSEYERILVALTQKWLPKCEKFPSVIYYLGLLRIPFYKNNKFNKIMIGDCIIRITKLGPDDVSKLLVGSGGIGATYNQLVPYLRIYIERALTATMLSMNGTQVSATIQG